MNTHDFSPSSQPVNRGLGIFERRLVCHHIDRVGGKALLICCARVTRNFFQRRVSDHRCYLFFGASGFGQAPCGSLAQFQKVGRIRNAAYTDRSCPELSAHVGGALLGICFGRGLWLRRQLKHRCLLPFT